LQLNPDSVDALIASEVDATQVRGDFDRALDTSQRIVSVDPLNLFVRLQTIWVTYNARRYDDSIRRAKTLLELSPQWPDPAFMGNAYIGLGDTGRALVPERLRGTGIEYVVFCTSVRVHGFG